MTKNALYSALHYLEFTSAEITDHASRTPLREIRNSRRCDKQDNVNPRRVHGADNHLCIPVHGRISSDFTTAISAFDPRILPGQIFVQTSRSFGQMGQIVIAGVGTFDFRAANYTVPNTFSFDNVTFTSTPEVTTGAICAEFGATLQNGSSYSLGACGFFQQSTISFTKQATPQAGVMLLPDRTAYVLVRV